MMPADTLGWIAAALMVITFSCRNPLWMRPLAVCTNLAFIGYACVAGLAPVLALHALLLPINLLRWWQSWQIALARKRDANESQPSIDVNQSSGLNATPSAVRRQL
jgi:hypothetical protein